MKNLIIGMACAAALSAASVADAATTIVPRPASPPAVSSGTAAGSPGASGTVSVTPSTAAPQGAAPGGGVAYPGCADEIRMYCPNMTGQAVDQCLARNAGRLSEACKRSRSGQR